MWAPYVINPHRLSIFLISINISLLLFTLLFSCSLAEPAGGWGRRCKEGEEEAAGDTTAMTREDYSSSSPARALKPLAAASFPLAAVVALKTRCSWWPTSFFFERIGESPSSLNKGGVNYIEA